jgi:hypothetical protein
VVSAPQRLRWEDDASRLGPDRLFVRDHDPCHGSRGTEGFSLKDRFEIGCQACSSSRRALASFGSSVSKPLVNQPKTAARAKIAGLNSLAPDRAGAAPCSLPRSSQDFAAAHAQIASASSTASGTKWRARPTIQIGHDADNGDETKKLTNNKTLFTKNLIDCNAVCLDDAECVTKAGVLDVFDIPQREQRFVCLSIYAISWQCGYGG